MKLPIVLLAVVALAVAARFLISDRDAAREPQARAQEPARAASRASRPPIAPQLAVATRVTADRRNDEPAVAGAAPASAAPAPSSAEVRDRLEGVFRAEPVDAAWSLSAVRTLDGKLGALLPARSSVRSVDCRGSLCRIETSHADVNDYRDFVQRAFLGQIELWNAGFFVNVLSDPTPGQPVVTVAYLAREGQSLPSHDSLFGAP